MTAKAPILAVEIPQVRLRTLVAVAVGCVMVIGFFSRRVSLFSDDYIFLDEARRMPFDLDYLASPLFGHFSPVTRTINAGIVGLLPDRSWLVFATVILFASCVVASVLALMVALFGRSWLALVGTAIAGSSLTLLPTANWFTPAMNMFPALAGSLVSFAALVFLVRGRTTWWALVAVLGYTIAVLGWELTTVVPGYAVIWLILFRSRVTVESLSSVLRRTWWVWLTLALIGALTVLNYWVNYYGSAPPVGIGTLMHAMYISLFETLVPTLLGFHDPSSPAYAILGTIVGFAVLTYSVTISMVRSAGAWRGWLFAILGWLLPCAALVLNRVGFWGVIVAEQAFYFMLPTVLFLVGALEAFACQARPLRSTSGPTWSSANPRVRRQRTVAVVCAVAVVVAAYIRSAPATLRGVFEYGGVAGTTAPERDYVPTFLASAGEISSDRGTFSVIDSVVPSGLVPAGFSPHNSLSRIAALWDPAIRFDAVDGTHWSADDTGRLYPVDIQWFYERRLTGEDQLALFQADRIDGSTNGGSCALVTGPDAHILVSLGETMTGGRLIVRTEYTVDRPTTSRLIVGAPDEPYVAANEQVKTWTPGSPGQLDPVTSDRFASLGYDTLDVGTTVCLTSVSVGQVVPAG